MDLWRWQKTDRKKEIRKTVAIRERERERERNRVARDHVCTRIRAARPMPLVRHCCGLIKDRCDPWKSQITGRSREYFPISWRTGRARRVRIITNLPSFRSEILPVTIFALFNCLVKYNIVNFHPWVILRSTWRIIWWIKKVQSEINAMLLVKRFARSLRL